MNSTVNPIFIEPQSIPQSDFLGKILGFSPARAGFYGIDSASTLIVSGNHLPTLRRLAAMDDSTSLLALETGGFSLADFLSLYPLSRVAIESWLAALPGERPARLLLPSSLTNILRLGSDASLSGIPVEWVADPAPGFASRLWVISRVAAGQMLLWAVPLLIFGWQSLLWGLAALLSGTLLLALIWRLTDLPPWTRGLLAGLLLALLAGLALVFGFQQPFSTILFSLLGLILAPAWLGVLLMGGKP